MATVIVNIVDGESAQWTAEGWTFQRKAVVHGLTGPAVTRLRSAVEALGVRIGDPHPDNPLAKLESVSPSMLGQSECEVNLTYKQKGKDPNQSSNNCTIEVSASLGQDDTNVDVDGDPILMNIGGKEFCGELKKLIPQVVIRASRQEEESPGAKAIEYVGAVNDGGWSLHPEAESRTWMCTGISGRTSDGGLTWEVSYEFSYRPDNWDERFIVHDPTTGKPMASDAWQMFQLYEEKSFNALNLNAGD